jgi:chromosome segregation ATPase
MKKWFFSSNGEVSSALSFDEAKEFLTNNPDVYGWHPSFNHWKPVSCISEFIGVVPASIPGPLIPKEISDKFLAKKHRLDSKLTSIDDSIKHSHKSLIKFEQQIEDYKELTKNLNDDVKGAISNIEKKYKTLNRKLSQVKDAVDIAETEMSEAVEEFDKRMNSNDILMPSCDQVNAIQINNLSNVDNSPGSKAKLAQEKLATPPKRSESSESKVTTFPKTTNRFKDTEKNKTLAESSSQPPKKQAESKKEANQSASVQNDDHKDGFNGMKNMMKSVFKGDSKVEQKVEVKKGKEEPLSMAERLKMAQNNQ